MNNINDEATLTISHLQVEDSVCGRLWDKQCLLGPLCDAVV